MNVEGLGLVSKQALTDIADAVRKKTGDSSGMRVKDMPEKILGIKGGASAKFKVALSAKPLSLNALTFNFKTTAKLGKE